MWSQHGFWNNLDTIQSQSVGGFAGSHPGFYPGYDQDTSLHYKQYGYDTYGQRHEPESPKRGKCLFYWIRILLE